MRKGAKIGAYATLKDCPDGADYRAIADRMTAQGHKMNFSSARNLFLSGMERFANAILVRTGESTTPETVNAMARNPHFQSYIMDVIEEIYRQRGVSISR
jgi:hypothetical protein